MIRDRIANFVLDASDIFDRVTDLFSWPRPLRRMAVVLFPIVMLALVVVSLPFRAIIAAMDELVRLYDMATYWVFDFGTFWNHQHEVRR